VNRARRISESYFFTFERIPDPLPYKRIGVIVFRIVVEPVFYFPFKAVVSEPANSDDRPYLLRNVFSLSDRVPGDLRAVTHLDRPFLHAAHLAFTHPADGRRMEFSSELPDDLQRVLDELREQIHGDRL